MKIITNIKTGYLGGIAATNMSVFNNFQGTNVNFVGVEFDMERHFRVSDMFHHLDHEWFKHYHVATIDLPLKEILKSAESLGDLKKYFRPVINEAREIIKKENPDVALIGGTYYVPWLLSIAAREENIPVVLKYDGVLTKETSHLTKRLRELFLSMEQDVTKNADFLIFPSSLCKEVVYNEVIRSPKVLNGVVLPNAISPIFTESQGVELSVNKRVAMLGRYTPIKNFETFFRLHKKLLKQKWSHKATIVTSPSEKLQKGMPKTITQINPMTPSELKLFYASQGLIVCPSHFETFGNVPIEAACLGIPVLVNKNMGCAEVLIEADLEDMVVDFNDEKEVLRKIKKLCGQYILKKQLNNLRKRVDSKYVSQLLIEYLSVFAKMSDKNNGK